jgi:hypothetical protein
VAFVQANDRVQYVQDIQLLTMDVRLGARTSHPSNLLGYYARNVRFRENLPFNVHPLDVVKAAKVTVHAKESVPTLSAR